MKRIKRRDFFKLSLIGGSLALTENLSSKLSEFDRNNFKHPWWVKELDSPTVKIDDKIYKRFDVKNNVFGSFAKYIGRRKMMELMRIRRERTRIYFKERRPGYRIEDRALADAGWVISRMGGLNKGLRSWNRLFVRTPEERGIERKPGRSLPAC